MRGERRFARPAHALGSCASEPAGWPCAAARARRIARQRRDRRLRAAEAPRRRPQRRSDPHFKPQKPPPPKEPKTVNWPFFGLNPARTRYLPAKGIKPPFANSGASPTGRCSSSRRSTSAASSTSSTTAASPTRSTPTPARCSGNGGSAASTPPRRPTTNTASTSSTSSPATSSSSTRKPARSIWKRTRCRAGPSPRRWSIDRTVYFGCENGELFALSTGNGNVRWSTPLGGPIKSAPAYYGGTPLRRRLRRLHERGRRQERQAGLAERLARPGLRRLRRLLLDPGGRLRPRLRRQQRRPRLQLRHLTTAPSPGATRPAATPTPGPTVANTRHSPPTVFIGSFDGNVYALDAKDGSVRWSRSAGGQVVGSLSAVGDIVYVAEFTGKTTSGFMMRSGRASSATRGHLHAGDLRRPPHLPDRLLEHHRAAALQPTRRWSAEVAALRRSPARRYSRRRRRRGGTGAKAGSARSGALRAREAGRVVLDPVGAGRAEVLVVDEHLGSARWRVDPGEAAC